MELRLPEWDVFEAFSIALAFSAVSFFLGSMTQNTPDIIMTLNSIIVPVAAVFVIVIGFMRY